MRELLSQPIAQLPASYLSHAIEKAARATGCMSPMATFLPLNSGWPWERDPLFAPWRKSVPQINSKPSHRGVFVNIPGSGIRANLCLGAILSCAFVWLVTAGCEPNAAAQAAKPVSTHHPNRAAYPSNAQLADPNIEARVDRLLRQMTLEEKIGQLVQYNDTGDAPASSSGPRGRGQARRDRRRKP